MQSGGTQSVPHSFDQIITGRETRETVESIVSKFKSGEYFVSVYGLGHVGAPIASVWLRAGVKVIGIDKSKKVIENTRNGVTHIPEPHVNESFTKGLTEGQLLVYDDPVKASVDSKLKMICVPVLIRKNKPDL